VGAQHLAREQVIRADVAAALGEFDGVAHLGDDDLMRLEQPRQHRRDLLHTVRRPRDCGDFRNMPRIADGDAAQGLYSLGHLVADLRLLFRGLVQEPMQLEEGHAAHKPVVLLVQAVEDLAVGEDSVQLLARLCPDLVAQRARQHPHRAEVLDLEAQLVQHRLAAPAIALEKMPVTLPYLGGIVRTASRLAPFAYHDRLPSPGYLPPHLATDKPPFRAYTAEGQPYDL